MKMMNLQTIGVLLDIKTFYIIDVLGWLNLLVRQTDNKISNNL